MSMFTIFSLTSMAALWLLAHHAVKRRFARLSAGLPDAYQSAIAVPPGEGTNPQLIALCIDLLRKAHCAVPFEALSPQEQQMALYAYGVETLPTWMSRYADLWLSRPNKNIMAQLRRIKSSRPDKPVQHFGAVKQQQRLRSTS